MLHKFTMLENPSPSSYGKRLSCMRSRVVYAQEVLFTSSPTSVHKLPQRGQSYSTHRDCTCSVTAIDEYSHRRKVLCQLLWRPLPWLFCSQAHTFEPRWFLCAHSYPIIQLAMGSKRFYKDLLGIVAVWSITSLPLWLEESCAFNGTAQRCDRITAWLMFCTLLWLGLLFGV